MRKIEWILPNCAVLVASKTNGGAANGSTLPFFQCLLQNGSVYAAPAALYFSQCPARIGDPSPRHPEKTPSEEAQASCSRILPSQLRVRAPEKSRRSAMADAQRLLPLFPRQSLRGQAARAV